MPAVPSLPHAKHTVRPARAKRSCWSPPQVAARSSLLSCWSLRPIPLKPSFLMFFLPQCAVPRNVPPVVSAQTITRDVAATP